MTVLAAHIENGAVVLDTPMSLPEGTQLRLEVVEQSDPNGNKANAESLSSWLLKYAGTVRDLPSDMAAQHDHYIHGTPKK